ncbi:hypothetical protein [Streptomyces erythrochromogenes]|uniref:hypothetical protein n=1 Tax=Streptomyces erythrochromogenes TaxID=285574 RepID=UPI0036F80BEC
MRSKIISGRGITLTLSMAAFLSLSIPGAAHAGKPTTVPTSAPALSIASDSSAQSRQTCSQVPARDRAALGGAAQSCVEFTEAASSKQRPVRPLAAMRSLAASSSADAEPTGQCDISKPGEWTYSRRGPLCLTGAQGRYTLYDDKGKELGTGLIDIDTSLVFSQVSTTLKETISLRVAKVTGEVKSLNIGFAVQCTSTCTPTTRRPWYGQKTLVEGQPATGEVAYNSRVASGAQDSFQTKYFMTVTANGATPVDPNMNWESPAELKIRCDENMGGTSTTRGCVIPVREPWSTHSQTPSTAPPQPSTSTVKHSAAMHRSRGARDWSGPIGRRPAKPRSIRSFGALTSTRTMSATSSPSTARWREEARERNARTSSPYSKTGRG